MTGSSTGVLFPEKLDTSRLDEGRDGAVEYLDSRFRGHRLALVVSVLLF